MWKKILVFLMIGVTMASIVGCKNNSVSVTEEDLEKVLQEIDNYYQSDKYKVDDYSMSFYYMDLTNMKVVVGLMDNSKEQQEGFKKNVVNSEYITFVQGRKLVDLKDYES